MVSRMSWGRSDCLVQFILTTTKVLLCVARQHRASCHMINTLFKFKTKQNKKKLGLFGTFFCFKTPLKTQTKTCCSLYSVTLSKIAVDFPLIKIAFLRDYYRVLSLETSWAGFSFFKYALWGREWMKLSGDSSLVLNDKTELHKLSKKLQNNLQRCVGTATSTHWSVKWKVKYLLLAHVFVSAKHFCDQAVVLLQKKDGPSAIMF